VDRFHELEDQRRSLAMLPPRSPGLDREQAMALLSELQQALVRLRHLRDRLAEVLAEADS